MGVFHGHTPAGLPTEHVDDPVIPSDWQDPQVKASLECLNKRIK